MQKELYEIAHETGLWIVLCNCIKVWGKIIQIRFLVLWAPQVEYHPAPLHWREDRHLSIQTSASHSKTTRVLPEPCHTPTFVIVRCTSSSTSKTSPLAKQCVNCSSALCPSHHAENSACLDQLTWHLWGNKNIPGLRELAVFWMILTIHWKYIKRDARGEVKQGSLKKTASEVGC